MSVIYIALPIAICLGGAAMIACVLSIRSGQYDDLDTPSLRMLIDDVDVAEPRERSEDEES
jgi:cbb3-type cytochrome oxidase maturation protein